LGEIILVLNISTSKQTSAAAEACLTEGWFLLEEQTFNLEKSLRYEYVLEHYSLQIIIIIQFFIYLYADSTNKTNSMELGPAVAPLKI
jgi:hypothetical protein